ncbi:Methyltransferase-like protein [Mycena sanguinolenta]|uniref:tRNA N(3)-methylcytidine methyltransferase n=1 Tax=Mycena sanguinolenta TaxID=230812 RepID=A0A8H6Z4X9_9AGAR|nr:Methyltransferase-like protein [Mycena sanguinolenta]
MEASTSSKQKSTSSVHDVTSEKPPFGSRFLTDEAAVWTQNAWDHVPPPDDQDEIIAASLLKQRSAPVPEDDKHKYNERPARHWDNFYRMMSTNFFRDRKWLHNEFRELMSATEVEVSPSFLFACTTANPRNPSQAGPMTILEVGCGTGAAMFPLLSSNQNPNLSLRAYDYSKHAVKLFQENDLYKAPPCGTIVADVWDLTSETLPEGVEPESADIVIMVFVFSALHPDEWTRAVTNIHKVLKPGGLLLLRDYGRYDMAQLRFKGGRLLDENFYIRGDKTRVYFFELDELALLFTGARAQPSTQPPIVTQIVEDDSEPNDTPIPTPPSESDEIQPPPIDSPEPEQEPAPTPPSPQPAPQIHPSLLSSPPAALFATEQLGVDRRLLLNRKRQVKMYRVWMQAKFRKLSPPPGT